MQFFTVTSERFTIYHIFPTLFLTKVIINHNRFIIKFSENTVTFPPNSLSNSSHLEFARECCTPGCRPCVVVFEYADVDSRRTHEWFHSPFNSISRHPSVGFLRREVVTVFLRSFVLSRKCLITRTIHNLSSFG